jgi:hypothetical protein
VRLPSKPTEFQWFPTQSSAGLLGSEAIETAVYPLTVVIVSKRQELALEVNGVPKQGLVEEVSPDRSNEPFHKRVGNRNVGDGLEFLNVEHAKIGLPAMKLEQRIVIGAEVTREALSGDGVVEQSARRYSIDIASVYPEAYEPASELVHHDQHSVGLQRD